MPCTPTYSPWSFSSQASHLHSGEAPLSKLQCLSSVPLRIHTFVECLAPSDFSEVHNILLSYVSSLNLLQRIIVPHVHCPKDPQSRDTENQAT